MFENLIAQESIRKQLIDGISGNKLPRSLLFSGEDYSGKMTAALELARGLSCTKSKAPWDCRCRACKDHRLMVNPDLLLLGQRYFLEEIKASAELLARTRAGYATYMFIRNVRKLLKRFEPLLWEGQEKKLENYATAFEHVHEAIERLDPEKPLMGEKKLESYLDDMIKEVRIIIPAVPVNIPVDQIRCINKWAHGTSNSKAKIVIIERADRLLDSAANSLLKILEEPPPHVTFVLTATRKGALIQTISSRVRCYDFTPRSLGDSASILEKLFRYEGERISLFQFFQKWSDSDYHFLSRHIRLLLDTCFTGGSLRDMDDLLLYFEKNKSKDEIKNFLKLLSNELRLRFTEDPELMNTVKGQVLISRIMEKLNESVENSRIYNQNSQLLLESLFYYMREEYEAFCT